MKRTLTELFDELGPEELDQLLPEEFDAAAPEGAMERVRSRAFQKVFPRRAGKKRFRPRRWLGLAAACLALVIALAGAAYAAEAREYGAAVRFFDENSLSTEGLSREDVKAVYRDITSQHFTYDKTAQVIERAVPGLEIDQRQPTPEELAELWNSKDPAKNPAASPFAPLDYRFEFVDKMDEELGFKVFDRCYLSHYKDGELVWRAEFDQFCVTGWAPVSGGTAVWGETSTWSSEQPSYAWAARVDGNGNILWQRQLDHGFKYEYISQVVDNGDGTWAAISRGDFEYLCLSQYDADGNELSFQNILVGNLGIWNVVRLGDGYLAQLGNNMEGETARLVRLDREGNLLDTFTYQGEDCDYVITDMIEFGGRVYLSAYAVPKQADAGGRHEIAGILDYLFDNGIMKISSEELTPLVRDNYTAVLLLCGPEGGAPETFYSVKGSLGGKLAVNDAGELVWNVESVVETFFSPATSSFTIGGTSQVFRYTFDATGALVRREDTGETAAYRR